MGARPFGGSREAGRNTVVQAIDDARRRMAGRVPPHNLEAEESLLGAMLLSRDAITAAVEAHVEASDYYKPAHVHIHEAVMALYGQGEPVDPVTIAEELRRAELLDAVGGRAALLRIQAATPASANAGHYAAHRQRARSPPAADRGRRRHRRDGVRHARGRRRDARPRRVDGVRGGGAASQRVARRHLRLAPDDARPARVDVRERHRGRGRAQRLPRARLAAARPPAFEPRDRGGAPRDGEVRRVGHADRRRLDGCGADRAGGLRARAGGPAGARARARRRPPCSQHRTLGVRGRRREARLQDHDPHGTCRPHHDHAPVPHRRRLEAARRHLRRRPGRRAAFDRNLRERTAPRGGGRHARVPHRERLSRRRLADDEHGVALGAPGVAAVRRQARCHGQAHLPVRTPSLHPAGAAEPGHHAVAPARALEEGVAGQAHPRCGVPPAAQTAGAVPQPALRRQRLGVRAQGRAGLDRVRRAVRAAGARRAAPAAPLRRGVAAPAPDGLVQRAGRCRRGRSR